MSDNLRQTLEIIGQDQASSAIRDVIATLKKLQSQAEKTSASLKGALGGEIAKEFDRLRTEVRSFGDGLADAAERGARAMKADVTVAIELREALSQVVAEQRRMAEGAKSARSSISGAAAAQAQTAAAQARASTSGLRNVRTLWGIRERSEKAELAHVQRVRRERAALGREMFRAGRGAATHTGHAVHRMTRPFTDSPAFIATAGAAFGIEAGRKIVEATVGIDTAAARYRMLAVPAGADAAAETAKARKSALLDSIRLGTGADVVLDMITKSIRDGVPTAIAKTLPQAISAASQVMSGDPEKLTDSLAEGLQEAFNMKWLKTPADARRYLNLEAGLSNFGGNSATKTEEFIQAGGLGHGKEMGLDLTNTMAYGAMLNASGARTGQASACFMGQLSQNVPKMFDKYTQAVKSRRNSEEDRAVRSAPSRLGYGSVREMQSRILAGPDGLIDFAARLQKLDDKARKLVLEGYGFSEQGGAMLAELGAGGGVKGKSILARAKELAEQREATDYLAQKFSDWQTSLAFMLKQIEAGWRAIESEVGDVLKTDIIAPFRDWGVEMAGAVVNSDLKGQLHKAIVGFVNGLGFTDVRAALDAMTANAHAVDIAGFARGIGEGLRAIGDDIAYLVHCIPGGGDAETIGKLATELAGLAVSAYVIGPVISIISSVAAAFMVLKEVLSGAWAVAEFVGIVGALKALSALPMAEAAAGLATLAGSIGVLIGLAGLAADKSMLAPPKSLDARGILDFLDPNLGNLILGKPGGATPADKAPKAETDPRARRKKLFNPTFLDDGDDFRSGIIRASYQASDSGDVIKESIVGTERAVNEVKDTLETTNRLLKLAAVPNLGGSAGGSGSGGGAPNMRYGRSGGGGDGGPAGPYRGSPTVAKGALAKNQREAYAAAKAEGLSDAAAKAMVANMSGESLRNPADYHWDATHMAQGIVQWDPERSAAIKKQFGKDPKDMSIPEQMKAAMWEINNNPRFAASKRALASGADPSQILGTLVKNYEAPRDYGAAMNTRLGFLSGLPRALAGNDGGDADISMSGNVGDRIASLKKAGLLSDEQCVTLAMGAAGIRKGGGADGGNVHDWRKGDSAEGGDLKAGTPVSTFLNRDGSQADRYAGGGSGTPGAGLDHAGVFDHYLLDKAGKRIGMAMAEQYSGSHGIHMKDYYFGKGAGEKNGSNYFAVRDSRGNYLGGPNNPMTVKVDPKTIAQQSPSEVAGQIQAHMRPDAAKGGQDGSSGGQDGSTHTHTHHNVINVNGVSDPRKAAEHMVSLTESIRSRTHDVDAFA